MLRWARSTPSATACAAHASTTSSSTRPRSAAAITHAGASTPAAPGTTALAQRRRRRRCHHQLVTSPVISATTPPKAASTREEFWVPTLPMKLPVLSTSDPTVAATRISEPAWSGATRRTVSPGADGTNSHADPDAPLTEHTMSVSSTPWMATMPVSASMSSGATNAVNSHRSPSVRMRGSTYMCSMRCRPLCRSSLPRSTTRPAGSGPITSPVTSGKIWTLPGSARTTNGSGMPFSSVTTTSSVSCGRSPKSTPTMVLSRIPSGKTR